MTPDIIIRKAKPSDIPDVIRLLDEAGFLTDGALYDTPDYFKKSIKSGIFFVAKHSGQGVVGLIHGESLICNGAVIWYFVVDQKIRNKGIGTLLLNTFESHCTKNNIKWIFGDSDINKKTISFYKKNKYSLSDKYIEFTKNL